MIRAQKPSRADIDSALNKASTSAYTYADVGATRHASAPQSGYVMDHNRIQLGYGYDCYTQAKKALADWNMFHLNWVQICWPQTPIEVGSMVGVLAYVGFWTLNPCRIVYTIYEGESAGDAGYISEQRVHQKTHCFGFGYGTLPGHLAKGEERFQVEWHPADDSVWYDILAFSQPNHWLSQLGYPVVRHFQRRFARDSKRAMSRAIRNQSLASI